MQRAIMFSGGIDSTAMLIEIIRRDEPYDRIIFCDTGVEFPETVAHIQNVSDVLQVPIEIIYPPKSFSELFMIRRSRGHRIGQRRGWPFVRMADWCTRDLKIRPLCRATVGQQCLIGINYDERSRCSSIPYGVMQSYPLVEWKITRDEARQICIEHDLLNPLYARGFTRTGCWLCPRQSMTSMRILRRDYPELWYSIPELDIWTISDWGRYGWASYEERFRNE